ncbi:hypothetical protein LguiB_023580 [Lonicera macranthoides]
MGIDFLEGVPFIFSWKLLSWYFAQNFELLGSGQVDDVLKEVNSDSLPRRTSFFVSGKRMGYSGLLTELVSQEKIGLSD